MFRRRYRAVSLYVRFVSDPEEDAVAAALAEAGALLWEVDRDVDIEHYPQGGIFRPAAVFRVLLDRDIPVHALLSAAAHCPCVFSVSPMRF